MPTKEFRPAILVAGLLYLVCLTLIAILILGIPIDKIFFNEFINPLFNIAPGPALLLISLIVVLSFLLGDLAENAVVAVIYFRKKYPDNKLPDDAWGAKSFFRLVAFAVLAIVILLFFVCKFESCKQIWAIIVIGFILETGATLSWLCWKRRIKLFEDEKKRKRYFYGFNGNAELKSKKKGVLNRLFNRIKLFLKSSKKKN